MNEDFKLFIYRTYAKPAKKIKKIKHLYNCLFETKFTDNYFNILKMLIIYFSFLSLFFYFLSKLTEKTKKIISENFFILGKESKLLLVNVRDKDPQILET